MAKNKGPTLYPPRIFNVYKPVGISSCSVVNHFKQNLPKGFGKIGHFGTLDPFADGILLIGIAGACRLNNQIHLDLPKTYIATGRLGKKTPSADIETLDHVDARDDLERNHQKIAMNLKELNAYFKKKFIGQYMQTPPVFSATKYQGKALYKWAREGKIIVKDPVQREIYDLKIISLQDDIMKFEVTASTGTYIRTLFEDICSELKTLGYLETLTRSRIGKLNGDVSLLVSQWPKYDVTNDDYIMGNSIGPEKILERKHLTLDKLDAKRFLLGNPIDLDMLSINTEEVFVYNLEDEILGVGKIEEHRLLPKINFSRLNL